MSSLLGEEDRYIFLLVDRFISFL